MANGTRKQKNPAASVATKDVVLRGDIGRSLKLHDGWNSSRDFLDDTQTIMRAFFAGKMNDKSMRCVIQAMRNGVAMFALELEHAKLSGRIPQKSTSLPSFRIGSRDE